MYGCTVHWTPRKEIIEMIARRQTKSSVIEKMPEVDTQEEEQPVQQNGHTKNGTGDKSILTSTREGSVHYFDSGAPGIYVKKANKYYPVLTGIIEVIPTSNSGTSVRQNSITIQVSSPEFGDRKV